MERRTLIAFLLIGLVTFAWMWHAQHRQRQAAERARPIESAAPAPAAAPASAPAAAPAVPPAPPVLKPVAPVPELGDLRLAGDGFKVETLWTNRGAYLRQASLVEYARRVNSPDHLLLLAASSPERGVFALLDPSGALPLDRQNYRLVSESPDRLIFEATFVNGLRVKKEFNLLPGKYEVAARITLENIGPNPVSGQYSIVAADRVVPEDLTAPELHGLIGSRYENGRLSLTEKTPGANEPFVRRNGPKEPILWAGAGSRYFAAVLRPIPPPGQTTMGLIESVTIGPLPQSESVPTRWGGVERADNIYVLMTTAARAVEPGKSLVDEYRYYLGPRKKEVLAETPDLEILVNYGFFGFISTFLLWILKGLYHIIPNYGVGIVLLTVLVKVAMFPITRKGQIGMHKMQRLQPQVRELQEKYKDDKQRQGREMMELYRRNDANPMMGCWPILVQIPIFWGLFQMLRYSIDLRHEGFLLWINDLAQPDTITHLGAFPINILPVLMTISWFFQQWTMPKPADPQQAQMQKMMLFMPVVFGFMFYDMAAGLTLYWLTSTFLGIVEQKFIRMQIQRMEAAGKFTVAEAEPPARAARERPPKRR